MIIKRGKTWTFSIETGREKDENANWKRKRKWSGGYPTKKAAVKAHAEAVSRLGRGEFIEPSRMTLAEYLADEWLPATKAHVAESTYANYQHQMKKLRNPSAWPSAAATTRHARTQPLLRRFARERPNTR